MRRRLSPRGRGWRSFDRRAAGTHDGDQRAGNRDRAGLLQQVQEASGPRVELGSLWRSPRGTPTFRRRPARLRPDDGKTLALRRLKGNGRAPLPLVPPRTGPRCGRRPALQHRRAPPTGSVWDGDSAFRRCGAKWTPSRSTISFVPYENVYGLGIEDTLHREPAISKIASAIGWRPSLSLDRILGDVIGHIRTNRSRINEEAVGAS